VNATIDSLFGSDDKVINPEKLMRMSRFPDVVARDVAKSADVFERTLANVRKHVQAGLKINLTESNYFATATAIGRAKKNDENLFQIFLIETYYRWNNWT